MMEHGLNASSLATALGNPASNSKIYRYITDPDSKPSFDFLEKLFSKFEDLNPEWLMTGRGPMRKPGTEGFAYPGDRIKMICEVYGITINDLAIRINQPPVFLLELIGDDSIGISKDLFVDILQEFPDLNPKWLLDGTGQMRREQGTATNKISFQVDYPGQIEIIYRKRTDAV